MAAPGKGKSLINPGLPIVTITLTAGTGSEINCWGVISNIKTKEKIGFGYPELTPVLAIVDPELMKTRFPPKYTAYQGFDALFHNTEVMMSNGVNGPKRTIALSAIENIAKYLPRAVENGDDLEAREHVAYGSTGRYPVAAHQHDCAAFNGTCYERISSQFAARSGPHYDF